MTASITDFNHFTEMRAAADPKAPAVLNEVANQFEALFLQMMLKNMRAASFGDPLMGDNKSHELYQDMMDKQLSLEMANGKGIGLAEKIVEQLGGTPAKRVTEAMPIYRPIQRAVAADKQPESRPVSGDIVANVTAPDTAQEAATKPKKTESTD